MTKKPKPHIILGQIIRGRWLPDPKLMAKAIDKAVRTNSVECLKALSAEYVWNQVAEVMENYPIDTEFTVPKNRKAWLYFVLTEGNKWLPVHAGDITPGGGLAWRTDERGGSSQGVAPPGYWAHCSVEDKPCLPFRMGLPDPE